MILVTAHFTTYQFDKLCVSNPKFNLDRSLLVLHRPHFLAVVLEQVMHESELIIVTLFHSIYD